MAKEYVKRKGPRTEPQGIPYTHWQEEARLMSEIKRDLLG